jgi:predicted Zn-dependent peptidase
MKAYKLESGLSYIPAYGNFSGLGISLSVGAGSFGQARKESAHALEHLLFCNRIDNKKAVETLVSLSNSNYNGLTDLDSVSFYALVPALEAKTITEVFSKMIQNLSFNENDINHEKTALKLEMSRFYTLSSKQSLRLYDKMYNNRQLNEALRPATDSEIDSLNKADLLEFYDEFFTPNNLSIAFFGNLSKDYIGFLVNNYFGEFSNTHKNKNIEIPKAAYNTDTEIIYSDTFKKSRLGFGLPLIPRTPKNETCRSYIYTISGVLSQNLQNLLRYDKGLVYSSKHHLEFNKTLGILC